MGLSPHADNSGITMLMECGNMPGLQVLSRDGRWVTFPPVPSSTVVNFGQIREVYRALDQGEGVHSDLLLSQPISSSWIFSTAPRRHWTHPSLPNPFAF
ncbi:hypothetical protein ACJRO7_006713 [Eucalyptus globulus]|uniref:Isopenicillin N synthase-like Fe(2+) 2OG dioxygenase domain-containing protein n=1 Tax=Eucalyptus globulus TaxID=34317 RepID=A0ABD3INN0_EUCGL